MSKRSIQLGELFGTKRAESRAWLVANDLDPAVVVLHQTIGVDENSITLLQFVFDGKRRVLVDGESVTEAVTVPLISAPENHGL